MNVRWGQVAVLGVALASCSRPNPAYDSGGSGSGDGSGSAGTLGSTSDSPSGDGMDGTAETTQSPPDDTTDSTDSGPLCPMGTPDPQRIRLNGMPVMCNNDEAEFPLLQLRVVEASPADALTFEAERCPNCICTGGAKMDGTWDLGIPMPPLSSGDCILVERVVDSDGPGCRFEAWMIYGNMAPVGAVSNVVEPSFPSNPPFSVELGPLSADCGQTCDGEDVVGDYALTFISPFDRERDVGPGLSTFVEPWTLHNIGAKIDDDCIEIAHWRIYNENPLPPL